MLIAALLRHPAPPLTRSTKIFDKLKQLYELRKQANEIKKTLESEVLEVESEGIRVRVSADQKIRELEIPDNVDPRKLKDVINKALDEAQKVAAKKMQGMMGDMSSLQNLFK
ncbi:MAG: hypothetical protein A2Y57_03605 [Candidatus Woykebacteria bacterium RBG_13_40_7b]|uniref:Nucleoid-associated protein, YbaB/EbfC family n=1 Tax=Candidatus Woykebacteria bacterium RBG_13_40_7b TaxID=1802594 RepID=A0A1G1WAU3_9BACT|nr:MAG: hypothetical protein A2Y57_03605 [Candidatus Woykebacteria bacterium RBG_13_40_7b]